MSYAHARQRNSAPESAENIGKSLGLIRTGNVWTGKCPCCNYKSGFTVQDSQGKVLVRCHAGGCDQKDVIEALRQLGLWGGEVDTEWTPPPRHQTTEQNQPNMSEIARKIWRETLPAEGTPVETYLRHRGITIPTPPTLRFAPSCWHRGSNRHHPAMVGAITVAPDRDVVAIHRTYLNGDGRKAALSDAKMTLGPKHGGAIRLAAAGSVLVIAEGVETALSAMQATGIPAWSALSAGGIKSLILPDAVREIIIAADHDSHRVGQNAAEAAAIRWVSEGRKVRIVLPPTVDSDFNDMLMEAEHVG